MKNIILPLVTLFLTGAISQAQYTGQIATNMSSGGADQGVTAGAISTLLGPISEASDKRNPQLEDIQGSPYTYNGFNPTQVYYKDENMGTLFYRYNALNEEIEIKQSIQEQGVRALGRDKRISIRVDGKPMSFKTFIDRNNTTMNGYLVHLVDGEKFDLYRRVRVIFSEGQKAQNSFVKAVPAKFSQFTEFYVQKNVVDRIDELIEKRRKILKMVDGEKRDELKEFIKERNLDVKDEQDLIQIFQYMNRM